MTDPNRDCIYDPHPENRNWRQQVEACTSYACPLYQYRPITKSRGDKTFGGTLSHRVSGLNSENAQNGLPERLKT